MTTGAPADAATQTVLHELLGSQRSAFHREGFPSAAVRRDRIDRLICLLTENADDLAAAVNADFGTRSAPVTLLSDIVGILPDLRITRARLAAWMKPKRVMPATRPFGVSTRIEPMPLGVVGIIGPWNFPIGLVAQPTAAAFAAGNRVMVKFSEATPRTAELYASLAARYFSPEEMTVVTGGPEIGSAFSSLPFNHLFFTGSPQVGSLVAQSAAKNLVPVTLELGGKNPAVVAHGSDLDRAATRIMAARLANGGQLCLCPDYAFVPREKVEEFVRLALRAGSKICPSVIANDDLVSMVDEKNFDRVIALIDDAVRRGARADQVKPQGEDLPNRPARRIAPTILRNVDDTMDIAHDEVFGPVLTVMPYDSVDEVINHINSRPTPLAAYWFGPMKTEFDRFRRSTLSGGMTVNDFAAHCAVVTAPFGGVGRSGTGAYHGRTGFDTFSHRRTVVTNRLRVSVAEMSTPPFSPKVNKAVRAYATRAGKAARRRISRSTKAQ